MKRESIVQIHQEDNSFSAGHFTIFSATERENLHGHNYKVHMSLEVVIFENGLAFDYRIYRQKLQNLCQTLDRLFLLPKFSPYLSIEETEEMYIAHFGSERLPFLKRDVRILEVVNVTIEELSHWFLQKFLDDASQLKKHGIQSLTVSVYNGPSQSALARSRIE